MEDYTLNNKYFFKVNSTDDWQDFTLEYEGLKVLSISGFDELGDATNVYNEQWINSNAEDFYIVGNEIIRKNVDLSMTIIVSRRYANFDIYDEEKMYNHFVNTLLKKDFYIYSDYTEKVAHVVCNKGFKPTSQLLHRGEKSYILATITLHLLDKPTFLHSCECDVESSAASNE